MGPINSLRPRVIDTLIDQHEKEFEALGETGSLESRVVIAYKLSALHGHNNKQLHEKHGQRFEEEVNTHTDNKAKRHQTGSMTLLVGAAKIGLLIGKFAHHGVTTAHTIYDAGTTACDLTDKVKENGKQENLTFDEYQKGKNETRRQEHSSDKRGYQEHFQKVINDLQAQGDKKGQLFSTIARA